MSVKAKFYVTVVSEYAHSKGQREVKLAPVTRGEDNKAWASATPSGEIRLNISNPAAAAQFDLGAEYYITFEKAEPA